MVWSLDARIPVTLVKDEAALTSALAAGPSAAVLAEAPPPVLADPELPMASFEPAGLAHPYGCGCCAGRPPAAEALDRLFQARVRGGCRWFDRVVALAETAEARAQVAAALTGDAVTVARFRAATPG